MSKKILIVDDSLSIRKIVSFMLQDRGYDVETAVDGRDALGKMDDLQADMVVTDLNMPNVNGIELIKQMRRRAAYKFTPVVMLTAESRETKMQEGNAAGANGWIMKPFSSEKLIETVKKFMG